MPPRLLLHLHGDPRVERPGAPPLALRGRAAGLVALVALHDGMARERAAQWLWPEAPNPRQNLRQQLLRFRQALGRPLIEGEDRLQLAADVQLSPAEAGAELLPGEPGGADEFGRWLRQQRAAGRQAERAARAQALAQAEQGGDLDRALALARQGHALDPADEPACAALMRVHYLRGEVAEGLAVFQALEQALRAAEGRPATAATRSLADALRRAAPVALASAQTPAAPPVTLHRPPRRVGRATEWQALAQAWNQRQVVLLEGEAGMGKSRLLGDWLQGRPGVIAGAGRPGDAGVPYATLARWLRPLRQPGTAPPALEWLDPMRPAAEARPVAPDALAAAVLGELAAAGVETVVLDDLHFADEATLDLVAALASSPQAPQRWLLAQRPADAGEATARVAGPLTEARRLVRVRLQPLGEADTADLVDDLGLPGLDTQTLAGALVRHTGGNPLFLLETLKQGLADGSLARGVLPRPAGVGALIEHRLQRLSELALALARIAAIGGADFSIELAEAATGQQALQLATAWSELHDAQVLRDEAFAHDLVAEAVLRGVPAVVARRVHALCAEWLATRGVEPARVAVHWLRGGQPARAGQAFMAAAFRARLAGRTMEEAALFDQAAQAFDAAGQRDERFAARCERGIALVSANFGDEALAELRDLVASADTDARRLRAARSLVDLLSERSESLEAVQVGEAALELSRRLGEHDATLRLACHVASALCRLGRAQEALALLLPLRPWVEAQSDAELHMLWHGDWAATLGHLGRLSEAVAAYDVARAAARRTGRADAEGRLMMNAAVTLRQGGWLDRALALSREGRALSDADPSDATHQRIASLVVARDEAETGCFGPALAALEATLPAFEATGAVFWAQACRLVLVPLWLNLGQPARAVPLLQPEPEGLPAWLQADRLLLQLELARALRQPLPALALQRVGPLAEADPHRKLALRVRALAHLPPEESVAQATPLAAELGRHERLGVVAALHVHRGRAWLALGRADEAAADALAVLALLERGVAPDSMYRPQAWWLAHQALAAAGRPDDAARALDQGAVWVTRVALPQVPPAFIDSFLHRNAVNRELLAAAARRGVA